MTVATRDHEQREAQKDRDALAVVREFFDRLPVKARPEKSPGACMLATCEGPAMPPDDVLCPFHERYYRRTDHDRCPCGRPLRRPGELARRTCSLCFLAERGGEEGGDRGTGGGT